MYWFCIINCVSRVSLLLPLFAGTVLGAALQLAGATVTKGPSNVESEMRFQSTWNLYVETALLKFQTVEK